MSPLAKFLVSSTLFSAFGAALTFVVNSFLGNETSWFFVGPFCLLSGVVVGMFLSHRPWRLFGEE